MDTQRTSGSTLPLALAIVRSRTVCILAALAAFVGCSSEPNADNPVDSGSGDGSTPADGRLPDGAADDTGPPGVLSPDDLEFVGFLRFPLEAGNLWFADSALALRKVGGVTRLFSYGNRPDGSPVFEVTVPSDSPKPVLADSPIMPLHRDWGDIRAGRALTGGGAGNVPGGLYWDAARNALWWTYGDIYVPTQQHPNLGATILDDTTTTHASYGPWRTEWGVQRTRGSLCPIPSAFADANTAGKNVGVMAAQASGNAGSPFGAILSAMSFPDPTTTPADTTTDTHVTVANHGLILHDLDHRQARDTRYKTSGWKTSYDCRVGGTLTTGIPLFGGADPGVGENDTMASVVWVDVPGKRGILYFGQLVTTPEGYTAPGDPDGLVHMWYGDPFRDDGTPAQTDCFGQDDPYWGATGPGAHYRVPMGWIYDPNNLVATAKGTTPLWGLTPTSIFQFKKRLPILNDRYGKIWGGAVFDAETRTIYVVLASHDNITAAPHARPVVVVFHVK